MPLNLFDSQVVFDELLEAQNLLDRLNADVVTYTAEMVAKRRELDVAEEALRRLKEDVGRAVTDVRKVSHAFTEGLTRAQMSTTVFCRKGQGYVIVFENDRNVLKPVTVIPLDSGPLPLGPHQPGEPDA